MKYLLPTAAAGLLLLAAQPAMAQVKLLEGFSHPQAVDGIDKLDIEFPRDQNGK